jgi:hypothetical protein
MRSWILWVGLMATGLLVAALAYGCGETSFGTCADNGTCIRDGGLLDGTGAGDTSTDVVAPSQDGGAGDDGSVLLHRDAATGEAGPGACNTMFEPKDEACLVDATYGVFVSPNGTASGAGTKESPLNSIDAGISLAVMQGGATPKSVYVCAGTYDETIAIAAARDKVKVYGGFACSDWSYTGVVPVLAPSTQGPALTLTGLTSALFVDLEIDAQSAPSTPPDAGSAAGASSIAVLANSVTGVEFRRTKLVAGNGQPGADGVLVGYAFPATAELNGNPADGGTGGAANSPTCPGGGVTTGGKGGDAPNGNGSVGLPSLGAGAGGTSSDCFNSNLGGGNGASASASADGAGALGLGSFASGVWLPAAGAVGVAGTPGQGGGGGGAASTMTGGGGGGGSGGCGGAGGGGGGGGGASVPVLAVESGVTLTNAMLRSGTAGNGGVGVAGQPGQSTAANGGGNPSPGGCLGGRGGSGGAGGAGGGGAGGVSAGILYQGTAPTVDTATTSNFTQGAAGLKGTGGVPGTNDGINGSTGIQVAGQ